MPSAAFVSSVVRAAASRFASAPAFVDADGRTATYVDLDRTADEVAVGLARRGVGPGSVVLLALPTCVEYAVAYVAASRLGAVTAGTNPRLSQGECQELADLVEPHVVFSEPADVNELRVGGAEPDPLAADPDRPVAVVFTSGTTGRSKGACFNERQLRAITDLDVGPAWGGGGSTILATSMAHVGFMVKLPGHLQRGTTMHLLERWRAGDVLRLVEEAGITSLGGVPTQMSLLLRNPQFSRRNLSTVQSVVLGAAPAPPALLREIRDRLGVPVSVRYSATETGGCGTGTAPDDPLDGSAGVGRPRGSIEVTVRDADDRALPAGEAGAVCIRSATNMDRYWRDPDATDAAFTADGAVRTGDVGWLDDEGRLHLTGRTKEMYIRGGYNVFPVEVESVLCDHPEVAAVAVVPRPDPVMGEAGVAFVVARPGQRPPTLDELRVFARDRVASYKLPDELRVVDDLPLTAGDKVDRRRLAELLNP